MHPDSGLDIKPLCFPVHDPVSHLLLQCVNAGTSPFLPTNNSNLEPQQMLSTALWLWLNDALNTSVWPKSKLRTVDSMVQCNTMVTQRNIANSENKCYRNNVRNNALLEMLRNTFSASSSIASPEKRTWQFYLLLIKADTSQQNIHF